MNYKAAELLKIYCAPDHWAEKNYTFQVLLGELLGISFDLIAEENAGSYRLVLPNGHELEIADHFFRRFDGQSWLHASNIPERPVQWSDPVQKGGTITGIYGRAYYQEAPQAICCGMDLVASAFFMLTRWEEYALAERDTWGRFPAAAALAVRAGFLDRPVVNEYAAFIKQMLVRLGWNRPFPARPFRLHLSHDVDHPRLWWSGAGRLRTLTGSLLRRRSWSETAFWLRGPLFSRRDPYDIFDTWMDFSERHGCVSHFNFLGARSPESDCYYPLQHPFMQQLLQKITARGHVIGFHPSHEAFADPIRFDQELASLRQAAPQPIRTGRHHYLCFSVPHSWQHWAAAGMAWDSTLGYPEAEGFRCGICCDFPVFDFLTRQTLSLREKPLLAMDVTLAQYRQYTPAQAAEKLNHLRQQVRQYGGEFVLLWHNSSWNTPFWAPWQAVYRDFVAS